MRWLGAVMIVVGCGMMGYLSSSTLARRTAALRSFVDGLTLLRSEIVDGRTPLPEAAALCARRCTGASARFFTAFCRELAGVQDLAGWYGQILHRPEWDLLPEDIVLLEPLRAVLGRYDGALQAEAIQACCQRLQQNGERAREEQQRRGRVQRATGLCCGIALALLTL